MKSTPKSTTWLTTPLIAWSCPTIQPDQRPWVAINPLYTVWPVDYHHPHQASQPHQELQEASPKHSPCHIITWTCWTHGLRTFMPILAQFIVPKKYTFRHECFPIIFAAKKNTCIKNRRDPIKKKTFPIIRNNAKKKRCGSFLANHWVCPQRRKDISARKERQKIAKLLIEQRYFQEKKNVHHKKKYSQTHTCFLHHAGCELFIARYHFFRCFFLLLDNIKWIMIPPLHT